MNHAHWTNKEETFYTYLQQKNHFFDYYAIIVKVRGYIYKEKKRKVNTHNPKRNNKEIEQQ